MNSPEDLQASNKDDLVSRLFNEPIVEQAERLNIAPERDEDELSWIMRVREAAVRASLESSQSELLEALKPFAILPDEDRGYDISHIGPKDFDKARALLERTSRHG
jgi:hypothetical protein